MALELAKNPVVLIVNDTAFAHGGLLPAHGAFSFLWSSVLPRPDNSLYLLVVAWM